MKKVWALFLCAFLAGQTLTGMDISDSQWKNLEKKLAGEMERELKELGYSYQNKVDKILNQFVPPGKKEILPEWKKLIREELASPQMPFSKEGKGILGKMEQEVKQAISGGSATGNGASSPSRGGSASGAGAASTSTSGTTSSGNSSPVSTPTKTSGVGGFLSKAYQNLFSSSPFMQKVGKILDKILGPGSSKDLSTLVKNVKKLLKQGITQNGKFSAKLFLYNLLWNKGSQWLMKKLSQITDKLKDKVSKKLTQWIQKLAGKNNWLGKLVKKNKKKIEKQKKKLLDKLQKKALDFVKKQLAKSKKKFQKRLGIPF